MVCEDYLLAKSRSVSRKDSMQQVQSFALWPTLFIHSLKT